MLSFIAGIICSTMLFALIKDNVAEWEEIDENSGDPGEIELSSITARHVTLSCQTCRKLKKHKEIESNLFQCLKCKRHVDIRSAK